MVNRKPEFSEQIQVLMKLFASVLLLTIAVSAFGQITVTGVVTAEGEIGGLPGVNVVEAGSNNGTVTDVDGRFSLQCKTSNPKIEFSFVGYKTVAVVAGTEPLSIMLELDHEMLDQPSMMYSPPLYTEFGVNSGVIHTPFGINIRNSMPVIRRTHSLTAITSATYRINKGDNSFFDVRLHLDNIIRRRYDRLDLLNFGIQGAYNKRNIVDGGHQWKVEEVNITPVLNINRIAFCVGYGRQSFNNIETLKSNQGYIFGLGIGVPNGTITGLAKKWNNYWQTEWQWRHYLVHNNFGFAVRFETLSDYREIDLTVFYHLYHR